MPRILRLAVMICVLQAGLGVLSVGPAWGADQQIVREQQTVIVGRTREEWRLVWDGTPSPVCGPEDIDTAVTCPCSGIAYGDYGKLSLVRRRAGHDIERMDLAPLFGAFDDPDPAKVAGAAYLQRWPLKSGDLERERSGDPGLLADIKRRPAARIMVLADYGRDGAATEFLVEVGTLPCGKRQFAALGVTKSVPHLHALASEAHPERPLVMPQAAWHALRAGPGPTAVPTWACGDHGSESRHELLVAAKDGAIRVKDREYSCPTGPEPEVLLNETDA